MSDISSKTLELNNFLNLLKNKKIVKNFQFYIQAQDAKIKSVWAPILTPLLGKDKLSEFCQNFNKESSLYYHEDVFIPVFFIIHPQKQYHFILRTPTLFFILKYLFDCDKVFRDPCSKRVFYYVTLEELYFILIIKYSSFYSCNAKSYLVNIINTLTRFSIKIVL
jgi:ribosomal protein L11